MKKILIILVIVIALLALSLSAIFFVGSYLSFDQTTYIESDYTALVLDGVRYVPLSLDVIDYSVMKPVALSDESVKVESEDWWDIFSPTVYVQDVVCDIPLVMVSPCYLSNSYLVPESKYDDCVAYIQNLKYSDSLLLFHEGVDLSQELSADLLYSHSNSLTIATYDNEWNSLGYYGIARYDLTGSFYRKIGTLLIRAQGDCYYFPGELNYNSTKQFYPEGEEYDRLTERYKEYQIDPNYWVELNEIAANLNE